MAKNGRAVAMTGLPLASVQGLPQEKVLSICGKLLSLGLIAEPEQRAVALGLVLIPWRWIHSLIAGVGFLEFIATQKGRLGEPSGLDDDPTAHHARKRILQPDLLQTRAGNLVG
jgi:hypothetical protein